MSDQTVKFGDRVTLNDGRVGVVTFLADPWMRFVKTNDSSQMWTWEPMATITRIHRQAPPIDGDMHGYLKDTPEWTS